MRFSKYLLAAVFALGLGSVAQAVPGYSTGAVNMRTGPSTKYHVIRVVPRGAHVQINGCLRGYSWCDVSYAGHRGWVSSRYLQRTGYRNGPRYVYRGGPDLGIPFVVFELFRHHDRPRYRHHRVYRDYRYDRDWRRHGREWRRHGREDWHRSHRGNPEWQWRNHPSQFPHGEGTQGSERHGNRLQHQNPHGEDMPRQRLPN